MKDDLDPLRRRRHVKREIGGTALQNT